jgi:hypothetical protein
MNYFTGSTKRRFNAHLVVFTVVVAGLGLPAGHASGAATISSTFVKIDDPNCVKVAGEEGEDWATLRCGKKVSGWQVYVEYSDARESIAFKRNGVLTDLQLYRFNSGFSTLGPTLEFRTKKGKPIAAVFRHIHSVNSSDSSVQRSALIVAKLSPKPCVVANIDPGPQQSAQARATADKAPSLPCLAAQE